MNFSDILASLIHDMKNSLGMVINTLDGLPEQAGACRLERNDVMALQQEAKRLNNNLIELLTLYQIENQRVTANIDELNLDEFLHEMALENQSAARGREIELEVVCDPDLNGYFDEGLIHGVLNTLIGNSLRYTRSRLRLSARQEDGWLVLEVADDGSGFPESMLRAQDAIDDHSALMAGRTHLGIYFSAMVAQLHTNRERKGFVRLENGGDLGGGRFSVWLP